MDVLPNGGIFKELQLVHDTGYFSSACSLEEHWQQVCQPRPLDSRSGGYDSAARLGTAAHASRSYDGDRVNFTLVDESQV